MSNGLDSENQKYIELLEKFLRSSINSINNKPNPKERLYNILNFLTPASVNLFNTILKNEETVAAAAAAEQGKPVASASAPPEKQQQHVSKIMQLLTAAAADALAETAKMKVTKAVANNKEVLKNPSEMMKILSAAAAEALSGSSKATKLAELKRPSKFMEL